MFDTDLLADLPAPHDDEPPSLRSDIADELLDHLQCAYRREVLKDGNEPAAQQRVLDRFGDPKKLARRLWWQAMWSRIMGKKILSGLQWVVTLAAVGLAIVVLRQQSEILTEMNAGRVADANWRTNLTMTLNDLRNRLPVQIGSSGTPHIGSLASGDYPTGGGSGSAMMVPGTAAAPGIGGTAAKTPVLTVKLVYETEDGPPVTDLLGEISLSGRRGTPLNQNGGPAAFPGIPGAMPAGGGFGPGMGFTAPLASDVGQYAFYGLEPDRYELQVQLNGQSGTKQVVIRDDQPQEMTVICPRPRKKVLVRVTAPPLPEDLRTARYVLKCTFWQAALELGQNKWLSESSHLHEVTFDPETGRMVSINSRNGGSLQNIVLQDTPPEDRVLFFETGPVYFQYETAQKLDGPGSVPVFSWPKDASKTPIRTVEPGENRWELELPEELIAEVRKQLAGLAPDESSGAKTKTDGEPGNKEGAAAEPLGDKCRLMVKLTSETKDGPAPKEATVQLLDEQREEISLHLHRGGQLIVTSRFEPDENGRCVIAPFEPGRYTLSVGFPDGRHLQQRLSLLRSGQERMEHVVCPPPVKKTTVMITAPPVPEDLRRPDVEFTAALASADITLEGRKWSLQPHSTKALSFHPETGLLETADQLDLRNDAPEERQLFLLEGPYRLTFEVNRRKELGGFISELHELAVWPPKTPKKERGDKPNYVAESGENQWEIKVPDEFWAAAQQKLAESIKPE